MVKKRCVTKVYGWENAKMLLNYFEAVGIVYQAHCHHSIWTVTYILEHDQYDGLPSRDYDPVDLNMAY